MSVHHEDFYQAHLELFRPTSEELEAHRELEQFADFKLIDVPGISEGRQSRVSVIEYEVNGEHYRVLWKRMAAGKNLDETEASDMDNMLMPYRQELVEQGWDVPETYFHKPVRINGETQIFSYDQFMPGGDGEKMIANPDIPNFRKWFMFRKVAETLANYDESTLERRIIANKEVTVLPHGLDLKLANVVASADGKVYFVDLFGPKQIDGKGNWKAYNTKLDSLPPESLKAVCATREGALLRFYRLGQEIWSEQTGMSKQVLDTEFLRELGQSGLPNSEIGFIKQQVEENYSWLDEIYSERAV